MYSTCTLASTNDNGRREKVRRRRLTFLFFQEYRGSGRVAASPFPIVVATQSETGGAKISIPI